ncbi:hypothetical protein BJ973_008613 [Actinoplanes tereljensis]|uniref:Uncharacterized protein n=1 Tax=Paractinoplanes tereljensis TaxID=571912 RepID=A0A919NH98_9ACTN|nr:hypothetical protein [Actinoplanes tereljensis]GIF18428.1 hypothetical protein Ate02nite_11580 [Actinoplanes tereljensis]
MEELTQKSPEGRAALVTLSEGSCYFPGCRTPILVFLDGRLEFNVEITRSNGALLLLCVPHRRIVDRDPTAHPAGLLRTWVPPAIRELDDLDEDRLPELLAEAFSTAREQINEALLRFEKTEGEAARLLRHLVDGLHDERSRYAADPVLVRLARLLDTIEPEARRAPRPERLNVGWRA